MDANKLTKNIECSLMLLAHTIDDLNKKYSYKSIAEQKYNTYCACNDVLNYTLYAIKDYLNNGLGIKVQKDIGEIYLRLFGLFQSIYLQQNAIRELYKVHEIDYTFPIRFAKIRKLSKYIAINPINIDNGRIVTILGKNKFDDNITSIHCYDNYIFKRIRSNINYRELIIAYLVELEKEIINIANLYARFDKGEDDYEEE